LDVCRSEAALKRWPHFGHSIKKRVYPAQIA
jgi:hypothetical protein